MRVWLYARVYVHMYERVCVREFVCACMLVCMRGFVACMHVYARVHMGACVRVYSSVPGMCVCMRMCVFTCDLLLS